MLDFLLSARLIVWYRNASRRNSGRLELKVMAGREGNKDLQDDLQLPGPERVAVIDVWRIEQHGDLAGARGFGR